MRKLVEILHREGEKVKGSRFVVDAFPANHADLPSILSQVRGQYSDASHHCYAWRMNDGQCRSFDDGEPRGSAGPPILRRMEAMDIVDTLVVVTRYFGGTKLGVGGLIRAYGGAAACALEHGVFEETKELVRIVFYFSYTESKAIQSVIASRQLRDLHYEYQEEIRVEAQISMDEEEDFRSLLMEKTSGRIRWEA